MLKSTSEDLFYPTVRDYKVAADEGDTSGPPPGGAMGGWGCTKVRRLVSGCFSPAEGLVWEGEGVGWVAKHRKLRGSNNLETVNER